MNPAFDLYGTAQVASLAVCGILAGVIAQAIYESLQERREQKRIAHERTYCVRQNWIAKRTEREEWYEKNFHSFEESMGEYQALLQAELGALCLYSITRDGKLSKSEEEQMAFLVKAMDETFVAPIPAFSERE